MARPKTCYICANCGYKALKWLGRCPGCGDWNTFSEQHYSVNRPIKIGNEPQLLESIVCSGEQRISTGIGELDRVLGGGLVEASVVLIGGDPGIGKSTLVLQAASFLQKKGLVLYITGEESPSQLKIRAERLGIECNDLFVLAETDYGSIVAQIKSIQPQIVVIDSIQTLSKPELGSVPGSMAQMREITASIIQMAKGECFSVFIVGHVTKEGIIAGPRLLEHMVDCVLYFEGDRYHSYRILRGVKNRFGSTNELGVFNMQENGLIEVENPSALFLSQRPLKASGSIVTSSMEGTRPILVEIQSLITPSTYGNPRRTSTGIDSNRVALIMAVLEKRVGLNLQNCDAFVNVVGGVRLFEPAVDLALALSLASSYKEVPCNQEEIVIGEIGLSGEVRAVNKFQERINEAAKLGFKRCLLPKSCAENACCSAFVDLIGVHTVSEALEVALKG